jgi:hypothetical protein
VNQLLQAASKFGRTTQTQFTIPSAELGPETYTAKAVRKQRPAVSKSIGKEKFTFSDRYNAAPITTLTVMLHMLLHPC